MKPLETSAFRLPDRLKSKAQPDLIAADEAHFAAISASLAQSTAELEIRLDEIRRHPGSRGQAALDRDLEVHRLSARLRALRRFSIDACLGRMVPTDGSGTVYIGRFGLTAPDGRRLLVDWRTPAAEPFFAATHARPMGLASRRRYRWTGGGVSDYWDEVFTLEGLENGAALDDQSAFIASLGASRSPRMRDVLGTIQADQDAIIRAGARGALVVDGGPGTGKTVVALHRAAYLAYADPHVGEGRGGMLFVGPSPAYLSYVEDVLPSLGEESVQTCTLRQLVAEGRTAVTEPDPLAARLKADRRLVDAIEPAVRLYEEPPTAGLVVETPWAELHLRPDDWAEAFASAEPGTPHNEARDQVWETVLGILLDQVDGEDVPLHQLRRALARHEELTRVFGRAWPLVEASVLVADLWTVPAYLRRCAPWLTPAEVETLQRPAGSAWTTADLPLLDAARRRLGDPAASRRRREREATLAAEREYMGQVVERLKEAGDEMLQWLDGDDLRNSLVDEAVLPAVDPDLLAGPFAHIIVDEAQELTDAEWRMLLARCPSRSFTVVGDRAQARHGFAESWQERLARVGLAEAALATLTVNYRTPSEVMTEAEPVIRAAIPDANVPTSIRSSGIPVRHAAVSERDAILEDWLSAHAEGTACVIGDPGFASGERVRSLTPELSKGLEFDLVVLIEPSGFGDGIEGAVDRYVAMTRATRELAVLER
ncbi:RNA polymerase recycling motor ATPase HelR [Microbacterium sp. M3]|uniref:RNA polymerase recycling motor ATPase HelR n=1 Tax=Microbacterium arthrosphaerae TaxID=792652 RepID=A0ABU4H301_9MICO|nr:MULTISPECIES: RNA polymerase recycling motor ATPase HelR [Microbacterium]MDW4573701.1 RNA polymerase recycling motor ATPase HelR [Microbacterium arthrosphaerae]MDW7607556.1 RNA polymerase recycling motor ATPase HelR [Microbacterium sp. M3]